MAKLESPRGEKRLEWRLWEWISSSGESRAKDRNCRIGKEQKPMADGFGEC